MGTVNFAWDNILVAVETDDWDDGEYDDFIDRLGEQLGEKLGGVPTDEYEKDGNRSYPGRVVWYDTVNRADGYEYAKIQVVVRSGYYSGINIDYTIEEGSERFEIEEEGRGTKTLERKVRTIENKLKRILPKFGERLVQLGSFSNGEAIYSRVK